MQAPRIPLDEVTRLELLREYEVLDSDPEDAFDALARLAAHVLAAPIALISLVDTHRQWFKARIGMEVTETPRDVSFCGHVVASGQPLHVPDARLDPRFSDNPLVRGPPGIVFYLGVPLRTPQGAVLGALCAIDGRPREVTPEQRAMVELLAGQVMAQLELRRHNRALARQRAETEIYRRFFELSPDLLCTADKAMRFVHLNPAWETTLGYSREELQTRPAIDLIHPDDRPMLFAAIGANSGSPLLALEARMVHKDGRTVPFSWASVGTDDLYFATAHNLQERVAADRLKADFISTVNHELRTPLTAIRGALGLVESGVTGPLPAEAAECVQIAHAGAIRLTRLINDILDLERIASGRLEFQLRSLDLCGAGARAIDTATPLATCHGIRLRLDPQGPGEPKVWADEDRLQQVLGNLLSNAIKFAPPGSEVLVAVTRRPGYGVASVMDAGPGVSEVFRPRLFQRFAQADSTNARRTEGSGLGLAICRELLDAMGGHITYEPRPGGGSLFAVSLPIALAG